ncbi:MAG TPA: transglutaminase domain-containing protein [Candidatus Dormibacteraeota bacterium]|nr:transglutaminase domain-containing protein [Candidatus Dormibacteraeota bacterium]
MTGAVAWSAALILLLTLMIARSTATAAWVPGIDSVVLVALGGAVLMGVLAALPVPWPIGLGAGLVIGPLAALEASWSQLHDAHPADPLSFGLAGIWWARLIHGAAPGDLPGYALVDDQTFYLFLISLLMWITGGWLAWCVLRWRRPLLGLIPGAAAFATNLLNSQNQNGYTLVILVLTLALLLWTNYTSSVANVTRARVKLTGDARWDFWESGLVAMAGMIALSILLPPLSITDRTASMQESVFSSWAALQERLNHGSGLGAGIGTGTVGFSTEVSLGGALKRSHNKVFTYTWAGDSGPKYFRGVDITETVDGQWRYAAAHYLTELPKDTVVQYLEQDQQLAQTTYIVDMITPPGNGNTDILFYPGLLHKASRLTMVTQVQQVQTAQGAGAIATVDRLTSLSPGVSNGTYTITSQYSIATEAQLSAASTKYPLWVLPYTAVPPGANYRPADVMDRIHQLALDIANKANAKTPYEKAKAIESYLRSTGGFTYTLTPPRTPEGADPIDFFLFTSKKGYCEFFATAMGDMLRSLGIPTRLVNGFGPGLFDLATHAYVVREDDAHTWVESYFPGYGWIPFEPTNDGTGSYNSIVRGAPPGSHPCISDSQCVTPTPGGNAGDPSPVPTVTPVVKPTTTGNTPSGPGGGFSLRMPDATTLMRIAGVLLAIVLVVLAAAVRYLRPRSVTLAWKRTLALAHMAGAERRPGETPNELVRRLATRFPEASGALRSLADGFVVAAYAPPDLAPSARSAVLEAWAAVRPLLLRRVASRLHLTRA